MAGSGAAEAGLSVIRTYSELVPKMLSDEPEVRHMAHVQFAMALGWLEARAKQRVDENLYESHRRVMRNLEPFAPIQIPGSRDAS